MHEVYPWHVACTRKNEWWVSLKNFLLFLFYLTPSFIGNFIPREMSLIKENNVPNFVEKKKREKIKIVIM